MSSNQSQVTSGLSDSLERVVALDAEIAEMEAAVKEKKAQRELVASLAVEEMESQGLDGVKALGRSWRVEHTHYMSAPGYRSKEILEAAKKAGCYDTVVAHSTSVLKSWIKDEAKARGVEGKDSWLDGTPFKGLVNEFIKPTLRSVKS